MGRPTKKSQQEHRRANLRPHPQRDRIIEVLRSHDEPLSPSQLNKIVGSSLGATAYHVRSLLAAGVIELAREGRVRGAVEHFYTLAPDFGEAQVNDPLATLLRLCGALMQPTANNGLSQPTPLDAQAREELQRVLDQVRPKVQKIAVAASRRRGS